MYRFTFTHVLTHTHTHITTMDWQSVESFGCPDPSATEREVEWGSTSRIVFIVKLMRSILSSVGKRVRCNDSGIIGKRTVRMCSLRIAPMGIHSIHRWTRLLTSLEWYSERRSRSGRVRTLCMRRSIVHERCSGENMGFAAKADQ